MLKSSIVLALSLSACVSYPKKPEDLKVNAKYELIGAPTDELKTCIMQIKNIITVVPTPIGPASAEEVLGEEAVVCGELDCSKANPPKSAFACVPMSALKQQ
jgi:hypothetical protein